MGAILRPEGGGTDVVCGAPNPPLLPLLFIELLALAGAPPKLKPLLALPLAPKVGLENVGVEPLLEPPKLKLEAGAGAGDEKLKFEDGAGAGAEKLKLEAGAGAGDEKLKLEDGAGAGAEKLKPEF